MIKGKVFSTIMVASCILLGCEKGDFDYSQYHTMKSQQLNYSDTLDFNFVSTKNATYRVFLSVRYTDEYEFSNIWWKVMDSKGSHRVEIPLFDKSGLPLGKCTGGICTQTMLWKNVTLNNQDTLNYSLVQNMRRNPLKNVSEVGVIISEERS